MQALSYKYGGCEALSALIEAGVVPFDFVTLGLLFSYHQTNVHVGTTDLPAVYLPLASKFPLTDGLTVLLNDPTFAESIELVRRLPVP